MTVGFSRGALCRIFTALSLLVFTYFSIMTVFNIAWAAPASNSNGPATDSNGVANGFWTIEKARLKPVASKATKNETEEITSAGEEPTGENELLNEEGDESSDQDDETTGEAKLLNDTAETESGVGASSSWSSVLEGGSFKDILQTTGQKIREGTSKLVGTGEVSFIQLPTIYLSVSDMSVGGFNCPRNTESLEIALRKVGFEICGTEEAGVGEDIYLKLPESAEVIVHAKIRTLPDTSIEDLCSVKTIVKLLAVRPRNRDAVLEVLSSERGISRSRLEAALRSRTRAIDSAAQRLRAKAIEKFLPERDTFEVHFVFRSLVYKSKKIDYPVARALLEPSSVLAILPVNVLHFDGSFEVTAYAPAPVIARKLAANYSFAKVTVRGKTIYLYPRKK
jgi:hypothetical protein